MTLPTCPGRTRGHDKDEYENKCQNTHNTKPTVIGNIFYVFVVRYMTSGVRKTVFRMVYSKRNFICDYSDSIVMNLQTRDEFTY